MSIENLKNNRERAIFLINQGGATKESLIADLGTSDKSLASLFAQLRLMGQFPMRDADGVFHFGTAEEFEASRVAKTPKRETVAKTPEQQYDAALKRESRAASAATTARKRYENDPSRVNELRCTIADAELELSSILLGQASAVCDGGVMETLGGVEGEGAGVDIL